MVDAGNFVPNEWKAYFQNYDHLLNKSTGSL